MQNLAKFRPVRIIVTHFLGIALTLGACTKAPMKIASDSGRVSTPQFMGLELSLQPAPEPKEINGYRRSSDRITIPLCIKNITDDAISLPKEVKLFLLITYYDKHGKEVKKILTKEISQLAGIKQLKAGEQKDFTAKFYPKLHTKIKKGVRDGQVRYMLQFDEQTIYEKP